MLDALAQICDDAGCLLGVTYALFGDGPHLVTAVALRFETLTAVFRAVPDDDTLAACIGAVAVPEDEAAEDVGNVPPWAGCVGRHASWAWRMTNQQGYTDGVRLELEDADGSPSMIVELVVIASGIEVFGAKRVARD